MKPHLAGSNRPGMLRAAMMIAAVSVMLGFTHKANADTINGTGWKGTAGNNNWSSTGNWDSAAPNTSGTGDRNLFFGQGYVNAGGTGSTTANNDLSGWHGYRITFQDIGSDSSGANDKNFTITGNSFTIYDFGGNFPRIENDSFVTQTFNLTSGQTLGLDGYNAGQKGEIDPVNGNIVFSAGTKIDLPTTNQLQIYGNNGNSVTFNGPISSSGNNNGNSVAINQNSTVIFAATNTYGGDTYVNAGTLRCATNNAVTNTTFIRLGDTSGTVGANLNLDGGLVMGAKINVRAGSSGAKVVANTTSTTGTATYSGNLFLDTNVTLFANSGGSVTLSGATLDLKNQTLTVDGTGSSTISGAMTNSTGSGKVIKNGTGSLTISGANTNSGGVTLNAGTLNINNAAALGSTAGTFTIAGGTIDNTTGSAITVNYPVAWNGDFSFTGTKDLTFATGAVTPSANRKITVNGGNLTVNSIIGGGAISLTKAGVGTLVLGTANTFSSGATISQGRITWNANAALGGTSGSPGTGGAVTLNDANTTASDTPSLLSSQAGTLPNNVTVANAGSGNPATIGNDAGNVSVSYSGTLTLNKAANLKCTNGPSSLATFSGKITGAGAPTITGGGVVRFGSTANDYSSDVTISFGTLRLNASGVIPDGSGKGTVILSPTSPNSATFDLNGFDETINGLTSSGTGSSIVDNSSSTAKTLTVGTVGSNPDGTFAGVIQNSGAATSLALSKAGSGKLTLTGKSTYGGGTTVTGGTLLVNGGSTGDSSSGTGSGTVSVSSGATLGGTGRIAGNVTFVSGALAVFTQGSPLAIGGTLTVNANVVHVNLPSNLGAGTYTLATYTSSGSSGAFNVNPVVDSGSFASGTTTSITTSGGNVNLVVQNITTTALTRTTGASPSTYGDTLTFHAVVSPDPGDGSTVTFRTNGVAFGTATTTAGAADLTTSALPYSGGSAYVVTAVFAGNVNNAASTGTLSGGQQVNQRAVSLSGTRAYDGTTNAAAAILSVANKVGSDDVSVASGTGGLAAATVGTQSVTSFGSLTLGGTTAGNYTFAGASGSVIVTQASSGVSLSSSANPVGYLSAVTFTASVASDASGSVTFYNGATPFSTNALAAGMAVSDSISTLPRGTNTITAIYGGDANYIASTNTLAQIVTNHPPVAADATYCRNTGVYAWHIAISDLLTNVTDVDGDTFTLVAVGASTNGIILTTNATSIGYYNTNSVADQFSYTVSDGHGGTATGTISLTVNPLVTGQDATVSTSGNAVQLVFHGIPGYSYVVQRSTNLISSWVDISTNAAAGNGVISLTDTFDDLGSNAPASAYYRLRQ
jgi:autotransporter-associated beta strand protein